MNLCCYAPSHIFQIIDTKERKIVKELTLISSSKISKIVHPATYLNKFLIGFGDGHLELWNFNTKKMLYSFKSHIDYIKSHSDDSEDSNTDKKVAVVGYSVTSLEQSPACDVIGIGLNTGDIVLLNIKFDQPLFSFKQTGGAVTSLSFRTDAGADKSPYLASSGEDGRIYIWNLGSSNSNNVSENQTTAERMQVKLGRKLQNTIDEAHFGAVNRVEFLYGEPILLSTGVDDNSLKVWIFDSPDGSARLLRSREGHRGPPLRIR